MRPRQGLLVALLALAAAGCSTAPGAARPAVHHNPLPTASAPAPEPAHDDIEAIDWSARSYNGVCPNGVERAGRPVPVDLDADGIDEVAVPVKCARTDAGAVPVYRIDAGKPVYLGLGLDGAAGEKLQAVLDDNGTLLIATYGWTPVTDRSAGFDAAVTREIALSSDGELLTRNTYYDPVVTYDAENEGLLAPDPTDPHATAPAIVPDSEHTHQH